MGTTRKQPQLSLSNRSSILRGGISLDARYCTGYDGGLGWLMLLSTPLTPM
jgi:hypothetical protein